MGAMRALKVLIFASLTLPLFLLAQDTSTTVRLADHSDWWSILNENLNSVVPSLPPEALHQAAATRFVMFPRTNRLFA